MVGMDREADAIADAGGEHAGVLPSGSNASTPARSVSLPQTAPSGWWLDPRLQSSPPAAHALRIIAGGADRYQHPLVVRAEGDVSRRMPAATRQFGDHGFGFCGRL